jgi:hypothetical protein
MFNALTSHRALEVVDVTGPRVILLFVVSSFPVSALAQVDPNAVPVLQQTLATMGGSGTARVADSVTLATVTDLGGESGPSVQGTIKTKGATLFRLDTNIGGRSSGVVFNGSRQRVMREGSWRPGPSANARNKRVEHVPVLLLAQELSRADCSVAYVGLEILGGTSAHHLRFTRISKRGDEYDEKRAKDSELEVFVDARTFVVLKVSYTLLSDTDWRRGVPMEIYYGDYRTVEGMLIPFYQRVLFDGRPTSEIRVTSFAINVGLPDSEFEGR